MNCRAEHVDVSTRATCSAWLKHLKMKSCTVDFAVGGDFCFGERAIVNAQRVIDAGWTPVFECGDDIEARRCEIDGAASGRVKRAVFVEHDVGRGFVDEVCDDVPISRAGYRVAPVGIYVGYVAKFEQGEDRRTYMGEEAELVCGTVRSVVYPVESCLAKGIYRADDFNGELSAYDCADSSRRVEVYDICPRQYLIAGWREFSGLCRNGPLSCHKVGPFCRIGVVATETDVPDTVELCDKPVGDVGIAEDKSCLLDYCLHGEIPLGMWNERIGMNERKREMWNWDGSGDIQSPIPHPSYLLRSDELRSCDCGYYACRGVPAPKKKGEHHNRTDRRVFELLGERQYHCRVAARFRCQFDRVVGHDTRFIIGRLPRGRHLIRCRRVGEVCSADGDLRVCVNLFVFGATYALDVLHRRADALVVHALPVELARFATQVRLYLGAYMDFVFWPHDTRFRVARASQCGIDAQPSVKGDVASVLAERLHSLKEPAYYAEVRVELSGCDVPIVHCKAQTARRVVRLFVDYDRTEKVVLLFLRIVPNYHSVVEGRLWSRTYHHICHLIFTSIWHPFGFGRPVPLLTTWPEQLSDASETARKDANSLAFSRAFAQDGLILKSNSAIEFPADKASKKPINMGVSTLVAEWGLAA